MSTQEPDPKKRATSRRDFLRAAGFTAADGSLISTLTPRTYREANDAIHRHGEGLFGTADPHRSSGMTGEVQ